MRKRTFSRELALQILYKVDITAADPVSSIDSFWKLNVEEDVQDEVKEFTRGIVIGVCSNLKEIDEYISRYATNWRLERMAYVDRNILRMGCYELIFCTDIPVKVAINEAVELAKKYSGPEAGKFVNGILDKVRLEKKP